MRMGMPSIHQDLRLRDLSLQIKSDQVQVLAAKPFVYKRY